MVLTFTMLFNLWIILLISNSWMMFLAVLEMTMMVMLFLRLQPSSSGDKTLFRYFLFQTFTSMCVVAFFVGYFSVGFILIILLIKLILPPFHVWLLMSMKFSHKWTFFWIMIIMKVPTFILFAVLATYYWAESSTTLSLLIWSGAFSLNLLWSSGNLLLFLMSSSFLHTLWAVVSLLISKNLFFCYYLLYSLIMYVLLMSMFSGFEFLLSNSWSWDVYLSLFLFSGAPPSFMFLMKWTLLFSLLKMSFMFFLVALVISGLSLYLYFRLLFIMIMRGTESVQVFQSSKVSYLLFLNLVGLLLWAVFLQLSFKLNSLLTFKVKS